MRSVVLLSGGWESALCLALACRSRSDVLAFFVDYGQSYASQERIASVSIARALGVPHFECSLPEINNLNGVFQARNVQLLRAASAHGGELWFGCRQLVHRFDRVYRDSNWQWARWTARELGVIIRTPCVLHPKALVRLRVRLLAATIVSHVFSSEGLS